MCKVFAFVFLSIVTISEQVGDMVHLVYYNMPPYIYRNSNGSLVGMIPDITDNIHQHCEVEPQFTFDTLNAENFTSVLDDSSIFSWDMVWLSLDKQIPDWAFKEDGLNLKGLTLFYSPGVDVLVHRDQVGLRTKVSIGMYRCRYLLLVCSILVVIFGVVICIVVRDIFY